jgi:hypothetical protein
MTEHIRSALTLADLPIGTRVRVPHRQGATGTVDAQYPARGEAPDMVGIRFDGKRVGFGLNYPQQCEVI